MSKYEEEFYVMKIRPYRYTPEDVDCNFCALQQAQGCTTDGCPFLQERLEAGVVDYQEAIWEAMKPDFRLRKRLHYFIAAYPGTLWNSPEHKRRFEWTKAVNRYRPNANEYYAAMYLLTANAAIYRHTWSCFSTRSIDFSRARLKGISPHNYVLFMAAKGIYTGINLIPPEDAADREIVDDCTFRLIVNAWLIAKFGLAALQIGTRTAAKGR